MSTFSQNFKIFILTRMPFLYEVFFYDIKGCLYLNTDMHLINSNDTCTFTLFISDFLQSLCSAPFSIILSNLAKSLNEFKNSLHISLKIYKGIKNPLL